MIKIITLIFGYLAFLLLGFFSTDSVLIENNTPAVIMPGVKSLVEVNVRKGDVQGFSKLELTLPDGFVATPGEIKGASFTFSGDRAKFVWMNLPEEQMFTITYYIESEPEVEGAYEIKGTFSYVKENKREDIYVPTRTVVVKTSIDAVTEEITTAAESKEGAAATSSNVYIVSPEGAVVRVEPPVLEMSCERRIERLGDNEYLVRLKVNNNKIVGFGKILEVLPDNCSTNRDNDGGAVITQEANSIKFVWFEVPVAPTFEVSYRVMCISDGTVPVIRGQVSYTENGNPFTVDVVQVDAPSDLNAQTANQAGNVVSDTTAANNTAASDTQNNTTQDSVHTAVNASDNNDTQSDGNTNTAQQTGGDIKATDITNNQQQNVSANGVSGDGQNVTGNLNNPDTSAQTSQNAQITSDARSDNQQGNTSNKGKSDSSKATSGAVTAQADNTKVAVKSIPSAEKGITYKVQIMAAHRVVDKTYLKKKFSFDQDYNIENHNGWVKYTTGSYTQYKDARDARVKITEESNKLPGPFVTAYNDGERITVQEALLISKQLWYK